MAIRLRNEPDLGRNLLDELERRHEEVIAQIDELAARIDATLAQFKPPTTITISSETQPS